MKKSDKTIVICHIEDGTKPYCFVLENQYDIVNMIYLVVVLSCSLKFILIVNKDRR